MDCILDPTKYSILPTTITMNQNPNEDGFAAADSDSEVWYLGDALREDTIFPVG